MKGGGRFHAWFACVWLLFCLPAAMANAAVDLYQASDFYVPVVGQIEFQLDTELSLELDEILNTPQRFTPLTTPTVGFGVTDSRIWLRFSVHNAEPQSGTWRLDINRNSFHQVSAYLVRQGSPVEALLQHTAYDNFHDRPIADRMLAADVKLQALETAQIVIAYISKTSSFMPLGIGSIEAVNARHQREDSKNWLLNGALLAIIVFALIMLPVIGRTLSLSFSAYMLMGTLFVFHSDAYTAQYFWPNHVYLNGALNLSFMSMVIVFGLQFSREMFDFKSHSPRLDNLLKAQMALGCVVALCSTIIFSSRTLILIAYYTVPIGSMLQMSSAIIAWRKRLLGYLPFFLGVVIVVLPFFYAAAAHWKPGTFDLAATLNFSHYSLVAECLAFATAITLRMLGLRQERDQALISELNATKDKLDMSSKLQKSQQDYIDARKQSDMRRTQLSSVSHDLQQPLTALRLALKNMKSTDEDAIQQMHTAFDYLEGLAREQLQTDKQPALSPTGDHLEVFPASIVLQNVREMFADEAADKGLEFRYRCSDDLVTTDPVSLMRAVSNLVSNAITHSQKGGVLLAARRRGNKLRVEVWDTGSGMSEGQLHSNIQRHHKSADSPGSGLGLAIVNELSGQFDLDFKMQSRQGYGTVASLSLALAD